MVVRDWLEVTLLMGTIVTGVGAILWKLARVSVKVEQLLKFFDARQCGDHAMRLDDLERRITKLEE